MRPFTGTPTDYKLKKHWLSQPENPDKPVDLIYLYPSSCQDIRAGVICKVDNKSMIWSARRNFAQQATVFGPVANLYAPFWRQVNAMKLSAMSFEEVDQAEWAEPRTDVYAALDHYFENLNQGRPYILAGHAQGSRLCYMVLSEYMKEHPDYYKRILMLEQRRQRTMSVSWSLGIQRGRKTKANLPWWSLPEQSRSIP